MVARIGVAALFSPFYVSTQRQNSTSLLTLAHLTCLHTTLYAILHTNFGHPLLQLICVHLYMLLILIYLMLYFVIFHCNGDASISLYNVPTDRPTDRPTYRPTDLSIYPAPYLLLLPT